MMAEYSEGFLRFWEAYPTKPSGRRQSKLKCWKAWLKYDLEDQAYELVDLLERYKESDKWHDGFEPMTLTWLNSTPWEPGTSIPPCTRKDDAEHKQRITDERVLAEQNELAQEIANRRAAKDEWAEIDEAWSELTPAEVRQVFKMYAEQEKMKPREKPVKAWWWKKRQKRIERGETDS